ncbi:tetratricopeptide repeat protein [Magnetococcus sp. PR-3]|uniref:tetratricopeptide repeat protein n=1 Tax=Magnetococcus sp. PR-3 TaxID=3120355 RepID=UPI002FCE06D1
MSKPPHLQLVSPSTSAVTVASPRLQRVRIGDRALNLYDIEELDPLCGISALLWSQPFLSSETFEGLRQWMEQPEEISMRVVVGESLSGKTRMAAELCKQVAEQWCCGFWQSDGGQKGKNRPSSVQMDRPTLIVVDQAPERAEALSGWLYELARHPDQVPYRLRVLFLADHGDPTWGWWRDLLESAGRARLHLSQYFDYSMTEPLTSVFMQPENRFNLLKSLVSHYSPGHSLGSYRPNLPWIEAMSKRDWAEDPLYLWMTAFVMARHEADEALLSLLFEDEPLKAERALGASLGQHLLGQLEGEQEALSLQMILFNTLCNGLTEATLTQHMVPVADSLGIEADRVRMLARRLRYVLKDFFAWPMAGDGRLPPLGPEPVAMAFISTHFLDLPQDHQKTLLKATMHVGGKWPLLQLVLCLHGEQDDQRFSQLAQRVEELVLDPEFPLNDLMDMVDSMPSGFGPVSHLEQTILSHLVHRLDDVVKGEVAHTYFPAFGHYCNMLAYVLSYLQKSEQALSYAQRSVITFEALVDEAPEVFEPDLADALSSCGLRLEEAGNYEEAVSVKDQAKVLFESLASRDPEQFTSGWARALNSLGVTLGGIKDHETAIQYCTQSISLFERLAKIHPRQFAPDYAAALNNTSNVLKEAGRMEEALEWVSRAAQAFDRLYQRDPHLHGANTVKSHSNRTFLLAELGRDEEALAEGEKSLILTREMMVREPEIYRPFMAELCEQFSKPLQRLGQHELSSKLLKESVNFYRELSKQAPHLYEERLASAIYQLADSNFERGDQALALQSVTEAVELYDQLAQRQPSEYNPLLVMALHNQSVVMANQGRTHEAIRAMRRTVGLYGVLELGDEAYLPAHVQALDSLSLFLRDANRNSEAAKVSGEAMVLLLSGYAQLSEEELDRIGPQVCRNRWLLCQGVSNNQGALDALGNLKDILIRRVLRDEAVEDGASLLESWEALIKSLVEDDRKDAAFETMEEAQSWFELHTDQAPEKLALIWLSGQGRMAMVKAQLLVTQGVGEKAMESAQFGTDRLAVLYEMDPLVYGPNMGQGYCEASDCARTLGLMQLAIEYRHKAVAVFDALVLAGQTQFMPTLGTERVNLATLLGREESGLQEAQDELHKACHLWPQCVERQAQSIEPLWVRSLELLALIKQRLGDEEGRYESLKTLVEQQQKMQHIGPALHFSARLTLADCLLEQFEHQPEKDTAQRLEQLHGALMPLEGFKCEIQHAGKLAEMLAIMAEMAFEVDAYQRSQSYAMWGEKLFTQRMVEPVVELRNYVRRARNFQRLAQHLVVEKQFKQAVEMARRAVEICKPLLNQEGQGDIIRPFVAVNHHQYAVCLMLVGQFGAVEPIAKQALMLMYDAFLTQPDSMREGLQSLLNSYENLVFRSHGTPVEKIKSQAWIMPVYTALEQHKPVDNTEANSWLTGLFSKVSQIWKR